MANIVVKRNSKSSSTNPFPTKNSKKSGSQKLAEFTARQSNSNAGTVTVKNPSSAEERNARMLITSTGERRAGVNRTQQTLVKIQDAKQQAALQKAIQQQQPKKDLLKILISTQKTDQKTQLDNIRAIMGSGYSSSSTFGKLSETHAMKKALLEDINLRSQRINARDTRLTSLGNQVKSAESNLNSYSKYIKNGEFTGTDKQYAAYQQAYTKYENAVTTYNRTVELQNEDISTLKKNQRSVDKKTTGKTTYTKIKTKYSSVNKAISSKLPSAETATPYIDKVLSTPPQPGVPITFYSLLKSNRTTKKYADQILEFNVGQYEAAKAKPLKAALTFVAFSVGGSVVKGLSSAAKALGAGAKTAKAAKLIEGGMLAVYATSTGIKYASVDNAREAGFVTGDVIFNELLPAGLGMKFGIRVVESIPKGARKIRGTGLKELAKSERAQVGGSKADKIIEARKKARAAQSLKMEQKYKSVQKTEEDLIAEFERQQSQFMQAEKELQSAGVIQKTASEKFTPRARTTVKFQDQVFASKKLKQLNSLEAQIKAKSKQLNQNVTKFEQLNKNYTPEQVQKLSQKQYQAHRNKTNNLIKQIQKQASELKLLNRQYAVLVKTIKSKKVTLIKQIQTPVSRIKQVPKTKITQVETLAQLQKPRQATRPKPASKQVSKVTQKQAPKNKGARRPKQTSASKAEPIPPIIPKLVSLSGSSKKSKRRVKKTGRAKTSRRQKNQVATLSSLVG
jgi:hypothetical protein